MFGCLAGLTRAAPLPSVAVDLGTLGGRFSFATAVNSSGRWSATARWTSARVARWVGVSSIAGGDNHAFSWTQKAGMIDLCTLGGTFSAARAVSPSGPVVGSSNLPVDAETHATLWQLH